MNPITHKLELPIAKRFLPKEQTCSSIHKSLHAIKTSKNFIIISHPIQPSRTLTVTDRCGASELRTHPVAFVRFNRHQIPQPTFPQSHRKPPRTSVPITVILHRSLHRNTHFSIPMIRSILALPVTYSMTFGNVLFAGRRSVLFLGPRSL
jgi:hypothetical protein